MRLLILLIIVSCSHNKKAQEHVAEYKEYKQKIEKAISQLPEMFPQLYTSQKESQDKIVKEVYVKLGLDKYTNAPKVYFSKFDSDWVYGLFNGKDVYINEQMWDQLPDNAKVHLVSHELGHWAGFEHADSHKCKNHIKSVMCGFSAGYDVGHVEEYRPKFYEDFNRMRFLF